MGLTDDDVREILRIIDESELAELRVETPEFSLYVRRDTGEADAEADAEAEAAEPQPSAPASASVSSPMIGIFYVADAPGDPPFVEVGSRVEPGTTVGIIEVMKMMNTVPAGVSGVIAEVCVENAELVEEGQTLFRVAP